MFNIKIQRVIFGLLRSVLLFYNILVNYLETDGFIMNLYNPCGANDMVNGHHMIVLWHINNLKVLHKYPFKIIMFATYLESMYGEKMRGRMGRYTITWE